MGTFLNIFYILNVTKFYNIELFVSFQDFTSVRKNKTLPNKAWYDLSDDESDDVLNICNEIFLR